MSKLKGYELGVIIPTFNERDNVKPLVQRLQSCLQDVHWQAIFVDDNSPDATAEVVRSLDSPHLTCIRRVGRRGLAGAVTEGVLASSAPFIAVIDGDQQHDENILPVMLNRLRAGEFDLLIGSRFLQSCSNEGLSQARTRASLIANKVVNRVLGTCLSDPLSGCFMVRRELLDSVAHRLYPEGFKILIDLIGVLPKSVRIGEQALTFRKRVSGESKLDSRIVLDFLCVLLRKLTGLSISSWFVPALLTAIVAVPLHLLVLYFMLLSNYSIAVSSLSGALSALCASYLLGNIFGYRDRRYRGWRWFTGWIWHTVLSLPGLGLNMAVALTCLDTGLPWAAAGLAAALSGLLWNTIITPLCTASIRR